jgi:hypothetical protein
MIRVILFILLLFITFWLGNLIATGKINNLTDIKSMKSCVISIGKICPDISPEFNFKI